MLMTIFHAHIQSHLFYLASIYTCATKSSIQKLQVLQSRALKIIHRLEPTFSTIKIFQSVVSNVLPVKALGFYQTCVFVRKHISNETHTNIKFETHSGAHNTRGNEKLKPVKVRREIGTAAIIYKGPQCYNSLPNSIIKEESTQSFKIKLKAYIIEEKLNEIL